MAFPDPFSSTRDSSRIRMLRRLGEIMDERCQLARQLSGFYESARMLSQTGELEAEDYERLESNPRFRPLWLEDKKLKDEWIGIVLELA